MACRVLSSFALKLTRQDSLTLTMPKASKKSFFTVTAGFEPGIYSNYKDVLKQTSGYSNAKFKKFESYQAALAFLHNAVQDKTKDSNSVLKSQVTKYLTKGLKELKELEESKKAEELLEEAAGPVKSEDCFPILAEECLEEVKQVSLKKVTES